MLPPFDSKCSGKTWNHYSCKKPKIQPNWGYLFLCQLKSDESQCSYRTDYHNHFFDRLNIQSDRKNEA